MDNVFGCRSIKFLKIQLSTGSLIHPKMSLMQQKFFSVSGNAGCIVLLAQAGADVNVTDAHGAYPIHYAANMARDTEKLPEDAPVVSKHILFEVIIT